MDGDVNCRLKLDMRSSNALLALGAVLAAVQQGPAWSPPAVDQIDVVWLAGSLFGRRGLDLYMY